MHCSTRPLGHSGLALAFALAFGPSLAQQAPDAGRILREQPRPPAAAPTVPPSPSAAPAAPSPQAAGPRVLVRAIRITGNTLIPEAELVARVQGLVGEQVSVAELQRAALVLTGYYAERGWVARVLVPPQDVRDGAVVFQVVEGVRGQVQVDASGQRLDKASLQRRIDARLPAGAPMNLDALSAATSIINDLPGVDAKSSIAPGRSEREVDVRLTATETPPTSFLLGLNNSGSRATGAWQATAGATLSNPTGRFDEASVLANVSDGTRFINGQYSVAVGDSGLQLGIDGSALSYRLTDAAFAALQPEGTARTLGLTASYPVIRQADFGLALAASIETRRLVDRTVAGETSNRSVDSATVGVDGYVILPEQFIGGFLSYDIGLTAGDVEQRNAAALAADLAGRNTQGGFSKMAWRLELVRPLDAAWTFTAKAKGQWAGQNLDSSESFSLGGPQGVRAYPTGEASGDEGWLLSLAINRRIGEAWRLGAFYDVGRIKLNDTVPAAGIATPNRYTLAGVGIRLDWQPTDQTVLTLTLAAPVGSNAGRSAAGNNVDGSRSTSARAWLNLVSQF